MLAALMLIGAAFATALAHEHEQLEHQMTDEKPRTNLSTPKVSSGNPVTATPPAKQKPAKIRSREELRPLARRIAENPQIMQRFYQARGSDNEALGLEVVEEIRNYARELDPTITFFEGTTMVLVLEEMFPR